MPFGKASWRTFSRIGADLRPDPGADSDEIVLFPSDLKLPYEALKSGMPRSDYWGHPIWLKSDEFPSLGFHHWGLKLAPSISDSQPIQINVIFALCKLNKDILQICLSQSDFLDLSASLGEHGDDAPQSSLRIIHNDLTKAS